MCSGPHVQHSLFFSNTNQKDFLDSLKKTLKYKFPWKPSSGNQVVPCRRTDKQTDSHYESNSLFFLNILTRLK